MLIGAAKIAVDKRSQYSIGLMSPVLCRHRYARLGTFAVAGTLLSQVKKSSVTSLGFGSKFQKNPLEKTKKKTRGFSDIKNSDKRKN